MADVFISYSQRAPEPTQALASALHDAMDARGVEVSPIERGGHATFTFRDSDGYIVTVNDSHVSGVV